MIKTALDVHHLLDQYSIERNTYQNMGIFVCYFKLIQILVYIIYIHVPAIERVRVQFPTAVANFSMRFFTLIFPGTGCFSFYIYIRACSHSQVRFQTWG